MCLIGIKTKGTPVTRLLKESVRVAFNGNRDGFGLAFKSAGSKTIWMRKGYFDIDSVISDINSLNIQAEDEFMFHGRMCTAGKVNDINCHPFVLGESVSKTGITVSKEKLEYPVMMHNGCIGELSYRNSDMSDTYWLSEVVFSRDKDESNKNLKLLKEDVKKLQLKYSDYLTYGKYSFMFPDRDIVMLGNFTEDPENKGYFFSHSGYKDWRYRDRGGVKIVVNEQEDEDKSSNEFSEYIIKKYDTNIISNTSNKNATCEIDGIINNATPIEFKDVASNNISKERYKQTRIGFSSYQNQISRTPIRQLNSQLVNKNISIRESNFKELTLVCKKNISNFKENHIYIITSLGSYKGVFLAKEFSSPNDVISSPISCDVISKGYFEVVPLLSYKRKYDDYKRCCENIIPSRNQAKKINKTLSTNYNKKSCNTKLVRDLSIEGLNEFFDVHLSSFLKI